MKQGDLQEANLAKRALKRMTPKKTALAFLMLAAFLLSGFLIRAQATNPTPTNYIYDGNQLIEIDFSDGSSLIFNYDANGNLISKTPGNQTQLYTITSSAGSGGNIWPSEPQGFQVASGTSHTFTITPDDGGWCISSVTVDGGSVGAIESYTFTNVAANHTISAAFTTCTYPITVSYTGNGTITPASANVHCWHWVRPNAADPMPQEIPLPEM